jgi:hypothetical protein
MSAGTITFLVFAVAMVVMMRRGGGCGMGHGGHDGHDSGRQDGRDDEAPHTPPRS